MLVRLVLGGTPGDDELLERPAELVAAHAPRSTPDGATHDFMYWHFGTLASFQLGGATWRSWAPALEQSLLSTYCADGAPWAALGPWGRDMQELGMAASAACALQVRYRYSKVARVE